MTTEVGAALPRFYFERCRGHGTRFVVGDRETGDAAITKSEEWAKLTVRDLNAGTAWFCADCGAWVLRRRDGDEPGDACDRCEGLPPE